MAGERLRASLSCGSGAATNFRVLFRLRFRHPYFHDGFARGIVALPDQMSSEIMRQYGIGLKNGESEVFVFVERGGLDRLVKENGDIFIRFDVVSQNPAYATWTEGLDPRSPPRYVWQGDAFAKNGLCQGEEIASYRNGLLQLVIPLRSFVLAQAEEGEVIEFSFTPRKTLWKYLLLGDWKDMPLKLVDMREQIRFSGAMTESISTGGRCVSFLSEQAIPLCERYDFRFQLRSGERDAEQVIIARMPLASSRNFYKSVVNGKTALVSEIFVSH